MNNLNLLNSDDTLILIIDIQEKLLNAVFNKEILEKKAEVIAKAASILNIPVIVSEQYPQGLGDTIAGVKDAIIDNASFFTKSTFNALEVEGLANLLKTLNRKNIVVLGIETHICVYQTAIALLNSGYNVNILLDACGSRAEKEFESALSILKLKGAEIKTTEMVLFEFLKSAKHPKFKEIQALIK